MDEPPSYLTGGWLDTLTSVGAVAPDTLYRGFLGVADDSLPEGLRSHPTHGWGGLALVLLMAVLLWRFVPTGGRVRR